jgi:HEPN domain-containing protein
VDKRKRRAIESWTDKAWNQQQTAGEHLKSQRYSESIEASQECIELAVKSILSLLDIEYSQSHWWDGEQFSSITRQIQDKQLLDRLEEQDLGYIRLPRLLLLAKLWAQFYLPAKHAFEAEYLAPARDLFGQKEAELAMQHANECYIAASQLLTAIVSQP